MALMFPRAFRAGADETAVGEQAVYAALRSGLDDQWWIFHDRLIEADGETGRIDFVALHPRRGIALLAVVAPGEEAAEEPAREAMRSMLLGQGFETLFGAPPPIVVVALNPAGLEAVAETLAAALADAATLVPADPDWVEWVADRLTDPADLEATASPIPSREPAGATGPAGARSARSWRDRPRLALAGGAGLVLLVVGGMLAAWPPVGPTTAALERRSLTARPEPPKVDERAAGLDPLPTAQAGEIFDRTDGAASVGQGEEAPQPARSSAARRAGRQRTPGPGWYRHEPGALPPNQDNRPR
jgi:hypothetical protein